MGDCHILDGTDIRYRINRDDRSMALKDGVIAGATHSLVIWLSAQNGVSRSKIRHSHSRYSWQSRMLNADAHGSDVSRIFQLAEVVLESIQAKRQQRTSSPYYSLYVALYHLISVFNAGNLHSG